MVAKTGLSDKTILRARCERINACRVYTLEDIAKFLDCKVKDLFDEVGFFVEATLFGGYDRGEISNLLQSPHMVGYACLHSGFVAGKAGHSGEDRGHRLQWRQCRCGYFHSRAAKLTTSIRDRRENSGHGKST